MSDNSLDYLIEIFYEIIKMRIHHDLEDTVSHEQIFLAKMKFFAERAKYSDLGHYLRNEVIIDLYNSGLEKAKKRDAEIAKMISEIRPTK